MKFEILFMKQIKTFAAAAFLLMSVPMVAGDEVLMTIGETEITRDEFEYIYNKNNANNTIDKKSLTEYLELFENFKLKVIEAEQRGMDTLPSFVNELRGYRSQLAKPYLTDLSMEETLCQEAYDHLKQDIEVSHVLVRLPQNATPADTLAAYQKALKAHDRIVAGEDFGTVADELSDDASVKNNHGHLGFFTGGMLVYPFEKAMFSLADGEVSMPVRTYYGYHVVKVLSHRPAVGQVNVSHIMKMVKRDATEADWQAAHDAIVAAAERVKNGEDFATVAKEVSDDRGTAARGGELPWFGVSRMVPEFEKAAFALQNEGDLSEPVRTQYGWHLLRLNGKRGLDPYEQKRPELLRQMQRDDRAQLGRTALTEKLKQEYNYQEKVGAMDGVVAFMKSHPTIDSLYFEDLETLTDTLATFADVVIMQRDLAFVVGITSNDGESSLANFDEKMRNFVVEQVLSYEDSQLEAKYPEFRYLMQEYHDGILLFDISNTEVWDKAAKDTEGLEAFFADNRSNYAWDEVHYKGRIVYCKDAATAKSVKKMIAKLPQDSVNSYLNTRVNNDSVTFVRTVTGLWKRGDNPMIDKLVFKDKKAEVVENLEFPEVFVVGKKLKKDPETFTDVRGAVTADYQNELERRWIEDLRAKYPIVVNEEVLKTIE